MKTRTSRLLRVASVESVSQVKVDMAEMKLRRVLIDTEWFQVETIHPIVIGVRLMSQRRKVKVMITGKRFVILVRQLTIRFLLVL